MIISASRRTDLPAFYPEDTIQRILHRTEKVNAVVFWTKNAAPIMPYLDMLDRECIPYYFQYTLNFYPEFEKNVPGLHDRIKTFKELSEKIGKHRVIWRFDPIVLTEGLKIQEVLGRMDDIAANIAPFTEKVVFSYYDKYFKCPDTLRGPDSKERALCRDAFRDIEEKYHITVATCAEEGIVGDESIVPNKCIDPVLFSRLGVTLDSSQKDKSQRKLCGCYPSVDIGTYHTCKHGCSYCYAR